MRKKLFILFVIIGLLKISGGYAQNLKMDEAQKKAEDFLLGKGIKRSLVPVENNDNMRKANGLNGASQEGVQPGYYIFNSENEDGFVIVAAGESASPVLAYSDNGSFVPGETPEPLKILLDEYEQAARLAKRAPAAGLQKARTSIAPLITTQWDQDRAPYNTYCPFVDGVKSVAGCVPVAMAQIMNYHKWPQETKALIPAREKYNPYYTQAEIPAGAKIDWDNMLDVYGASYTEEQAEAVGRLMLYCGQSLPSIVYNAGTGATTYEVEASMRDIFDYDDDIQYVKRSSYSIAQWSELIYREIKAGRPVLMSGATGEGSGHAFVCDGYDGEELFHINWGWSGFNGYYSIELLSPTLEEGYEHLYDGEAYSFEREAIIGIHKPDGKPAEKKSSQRLTTANVIIDGSALYPEMLTGSVTDTYDFEYGFGLVGADGEITPLVTKSQKEMLYGFSATILADRKFDMAGLFDAAGVYKVIPISRIMGTVAWYRNTPGNIYIEASVNQTGRVALAFKEEEIKLEATELKVLGDLIAGNPHSVEVTIKNSGEEFFGTLYMRAAGKYETLSSSTSVALKAGGTGKFYFPIQPYDSGNYSITVSTDPYGDDVIGTASCAMKELNNSAANLTITHNLGEIVAGDEASFNVVATNNGGKYLNSIVVEIRCDGQFFDVQEFFVEIEGGKNISIPVKISGITPGKQYQTALYYYSNYQVVVAKEFTFRGAKAITYYDASGKKNMLPVSAAFTMPDGATAVNLSEAGSVSVAPNKNPNALYYIADGQNVTGLDGCNVVVNYKAGEIVLVDGYDFHIPYSFSAQKASYERTAQGKKWDALVLPFTATTVIADGAVMPFVADENGDGLHLVDFCYVDAEHKIVTEYSDSRVEAFKPYLFSLSADAQSLIFAGENCTFVSESKMQSYTEEYKFAGTMNYKKCTAYVINNQGTAFEVATDAVVQPFRACFVANNQSGISPETDVLNIEYANADILGDINGDGETDVADVTTLIAIILETTVATNPVDLNGDGETDIADVTTLIAMILNEM